MHWLQGTPRETAPCSEPDQDQAIPAQALRAQPPGFETPAVGNGGVPAAATAVAGRVPFSGVLNSTWLLRNQQVLWRIKYLRVSRFKGTDWLLLINSPVQEAKF